MKKFATVVAFAVGLSCSFAQAKGNRGTFGLHVGLGVPFVTQAGADIYFNDNWGLELGFNQLSVSAGVAKVALTMPELLVKWHPFSGSFFMAAGLGQETLSSKATDALTAQTAELKLTANASVVKLGWMWGSGNGGFWFGMDASYVMPSGAKAEITSTLPPTSDTYKEAEEQAKKFGELAYTNITFARLGWLF